MKTESTPPHGGGRLEIRGRPLGAGRAALIMVHGRHAAPANILELAVPLDHPDVTYLAPAAADGTWYPYSFMADIAENEPGIGSGIAVVHNLVRRLVDVGIVTERIILLGFSQGACLAAEYAVRHPARFGGVLVFSGGLIGPPGTTWPGTNGFDDTPVFLGCSDVDSHVPLERVEESAIVFGQMGATVTKRIYPGMGHLVAQDELDFARALVQTVADR